MTYSKDKFQNQDNYKIYDGESPQLSNVTLQYFSENTLSALITAINSFKEGSPDSRYKSLNTFYNGTTNKYEAVLAYMA
jgi:hypothetical protein